MLKHLITLSLAAAFAGIVSAGAAQAEMKKAWIDYTHGTKKLKGFIAYDDAQKGKRPAVLILHDRAGMTEHSQGHAETYARLGYVAFVADIFGYGEGVLPKDAAAMSEQTTIFRKDPALTKARVQAGWDTLAKQPMVDISRIAAIGYCFGGAVGVEYGATGAPLALNVAIHGSFDKNHATGWSKTVKGRYLILHGAEDKNYPLSTVATVIDDLRSSHIAFQLEVYSGATHGFSVPKGKDNERANAQSIASATRAMREVFGM